MNFSDLIKFANQASAFELYRLRVAINRILEDPKWLNAVQSRLQPGQEVQYFNDRFNALRRGRVLELCKKYVSVLDLEDGKRWRVPYPAFNLDGADVSIREHKSKGLGRNEVAIGDALGFIDRDRQQRTGKVIRLNDLTVTLLCDNTKWRVYYQHLHRVLDSDGLKHDVIEIGGTWVTQEAQ